MKRQHPVKILMLMPKNFWLLAIPLARGLLTLRIDFVTLTDWVHGVWLDILVVLFIILAAYFKWFFTTFSFSKDGITCDSGIFVRVHNAIPMNKICAVTGEKKFWLRPFRAVNIYFDNETGIPKKTAVSLTVRYSDYREMFDILAEKKTAG